ncbi:MAG: HNH endonuclease [Solirubrobacteraceae bacterium]|nr:HNH endonuclease [Patulibacter sp.]
MCSQSGCPRRALRNGRCDDHARERDRRKQEAHWRSTGSTLAQRMETWRRFDGMCQGCGEPTRRPDTRDDGEQLRPIREHLAAVADGGTDDDENIALLCHLCADVKTADARRRGLSG